MKQAQGELECVLNARRAASLLHPLRLRIVTEAREPASATEIAQRLKLPRQKVNYHLRELARLRFLRRAGQRKRRNMIERKWVASARNYLLAPQILGDLRADAGHLQDVFSAAYLLALTAQAQAEIAVAGERATTQGKRLATMSLSAELRFETAAQRETFARALTDAVTSVVARHASPAITSGGAPGPGRPYRLVLGCYPIPQSEESHS